MERLVLISDVSSEFPGNTASSFKVRLPRALQYEGEWEVTLISISLPDEGLNLDQCSPESAHIMLRHKYRVDFTNNANRFILKTDDLTKEDVVGREVDIVNGRQFMQNVTDQLDWKLTRTLQTVPYGIVADARRSRWEFIAEHLFLWRSEDLDFIAPDIAIELDVHLSLCMGWLVKKTDGSYDLGPNLRYALHHRTGTHKYKTVKLMSTELPGNVLWLVANQRLRLTLTVDWKFTNIDTAFEAAFSRRHRTLMVYTDIVGSTLMGTSEHPLLREVQYTRQGAGVVYFEPLHPQWVPLRRSLIDTIEIEIAEKTGKLTKFGSGRSVVTIGLRRVQKV